jgi:hypothetical protein
VVLPFSAFFCFFALKFSIDMIEKLPYLDTSDQANNYFGWAYRDEDLLEYMVEAADHFSPSVDPDCFETVVGEDGKKRDGKRTPQLLPSNDPNCFGNRFGEGKIEGYREEEYLKDQALHNMLKNFGIDKDKFWYLCLYVKDYTLDKTSGSMVSENSPKEDLDDILDSILEGLTFTLPFRASKEVEDILCDEKYRPYYVDDEEKGWMKQVVPDEFTEAQNKYYEEKKNWKPEYKKLMSYPKEELTKDTVSNVLEYMLNSQNYKNSTWYFEKKPKLSLRLGTGHSLEVTNPTAILALAYALHQVKEDLGKIDNLNISSVDFNNKVSLGESYKLFQFYKMLSWFLKEKKSLGIPNVSTNKSLLISKMVYYTGLSEKEDFKKDYVENSKGKFVANTILKDAIKKVDEKKLKKMHNNIYWT